MSYHIYTTEGIILKRTPFGEANILLSVLTEDLGLIIASARSARLAVSKLRPALQEYSLVSISCVKGKGGWKVTNVAGSGNLYYDLPEYSHLVLANISQILLKMITGEDPHPEIYKLVRFGLGYLKDINKDDIHNLETLLVLRILFELGYVAKTVEVDKFLETPYIWSAELLLGVSKEKTQLIATINKALKASHL
jgi:DNA repair protein RecO